MQRLKSSLLTFFETLFFFSFRVLVRAIQSIVETVVASSGHGSPLLVHFLSELMPSQPQWKRIRQDLPFQVRKASLILIDARKLI